MNAKKIVILSVIAVIIVVGFVLGAKFRSGGTADQTQYKVTQVSLGMVKKTVSATGTLQPWTVVDIKSKAGGRVNALLVDAGSIVKNNQILARIDPTDTVLAVNTAQADIDSGRAKELQSDQIYNLQLQQSKTTIANAQESLRSAIANRDAVAARLDTARSQSASQPSLTAATINSAHANWVNAQQQRLQLNTTNPQDHASAKAAYDEAVANKNNLQANYTRQKTLLDKGYVAQQVVDQALANAEVADAQVAAASEKLNTIDAEQQSAIEAADARVAQAKAQWENAKASRVDIDSKKQAVMEAVAALSQSNAQVDQAKSALNQAMADQTNNTIRRYDIAAAKAGLNRAEATMTNAKTTLDQTVVRAPSDGVILKKYVEQGTIITSGLSLNSTGTSIVQLGDISRMYVDVPVDETDVANVDEGQNVDVSFDAYPGVSFEGKVARIDPQSDVIQNVTTFHVRVEIDNSAPTFRLLKPGMNATCDFVIDKKDSVVNIPSEAMRSDDKGSYVEVAIGGKPAPGDPKTNTPPDPNILLGVKTQHRSIETGLEGNDSVEVTSGLKPGEMVVTEKIEPTPQQTTSPFAAGGGRPGGGFGGGGGGRR